MDDKTLPKDWRWVRFGEVVREVRETTKNPESEGLTRVVGLEHLDPDSLPLTRWAELSDLPDGTSFSRVFRAGQALFGKRRAYQRKVAVPSFEGVCSGDILVFEPSSSDLLPEFLPYLLLSDGFFEHALGTSAGSLSPRTKWQELAKYEFALPTIQEQHDRISILKAIDEMVDRYSAVLDAADALTDAMAASLVVSSGGRSVPLGEVADVRYGLTLGPKRRQLDVEAPYLRVANVQRGSIDLGEIKTVGVEEDDFKRYGLKFEDLLVVEGHASREEVGRAAMWTRKGEDMLHQNHLIRVRCSHTVRPRVVLELLNSSLGRAYFTANAKSTSGLNTVNSTTVKHFPVPTLESATQESAEIQLFALDSLAARASDSVRGALIVRRALIDALVGGADV